jgi:hypothetical protein
MDRDALVRAPHSDLGDVGLAEVPTRPDASFPAFRRVGPTDDPILSWSRQRCDRGAEDPWAGSGAVVAADASGRKTRRVRRSPTEGIRVPIPAIMTPERFAVAQIQLEATE